MIPTLQQTIARAAALNAEKPERIRELASLAEMRRRSYAYLQKLGYTETTPEGPVSR